MNRRNFMKTLALAVGASPLALAAKPEVPFENLGRELTKWKAESGRWYFVTDGQLVACEPPVFTELNRFSENGFTEGDDWEGHIFFRGVPVFYKRNLEAK